VKEQQTTENMVRTEDPSVSTHGIAVPLPSIPTKPTGSGLLPPPPPVSATNLLAPPFSMDNSFPPPPSFPSPSDHPPPPPPPTISLSDNSLLPPPPPPAACSTRRYLDAEDATEHMTRDTDESTSSLLHLTPKTDLKQEIQEMN
ncbi:hypothetical protein XENOCAPTIV_010846, partial [Xenoophorus captivus]